MPERVSGWVVGLTVAVLVGLSGAPGHAASAEPAPAEPGDPAESPLVVRTQSYEIRFSTRGTPVSWRIIDPRFIRESTNDGIELSGNQTQGPPFPLELELPTAAGLDSAPFEAERFEENDRFVTRFRSSTSLSGLGVIRTYRIPQQGFDTELTITLINEGGKPLVFDEQGVGVSLRLGPGLGVASAASGGLGQSFYTYERPVFGLADTVEDLKLSAKEPEQLFDGPAGIRWGGVHSRYFMAILSAAPGGAINSANSGKAWLNEEPVTGRLRPLMALGSEPITIAPGESVDVGYRLFFGPKDRQILRSSDLGLQDILFPGLWNWMRWLCFALTSVLSWLYGMLHSWGLSIIGLAVVVRILTFPVSQIGLRQQAAMAADQARIQPFIAEINEKYKDDAGRRSQALMDLYKEHGISPFASLKGCLWVLIQLPIFVALFNLIGQAFELRGASFLWIRDLSQPDQLFPLGVDLPLLGAYFNLLPILMAAAQVMVTQLSPSPEADPAEGAKQKKVMSFMAIAFLLLFYSFPSGLVLYWTMTNLFQFLQQRLTARYLA